MFVDLKNPYSENEYITKGNLILQSNLQIKGNPYQGINGIFHRPKQTISQFLQKYKTTPITEAILRKKNGTGGINLLDFGLYDKATVIKTVCTGTKTEIQINGIDRQSRDKPTYLWSTNL